MSQQVWMPNIIVNIPLYFTGFTISLMYIYIYIYTELAPKLSATAICRSVVEHWSNNPEDVGSITSRKVLELHFPQHNFIYIMCFTHAVIGQLLCLDRVIETWLWFYSIFPVIFYKRNRKWKCLHSLMKTSERES